MRTIWFWVCFTTAVFLLIEILFIGYPCKYFYFNKRIYGEELSSVAYSYWAKVNVKDNFLAVAIQCWNLTDFVFFNFSTISEFIKDGNYAGVSISWSQLRTDRDVPFLIFQSYFPEVSDLHISFQFGRTLPKESFVDIKTITRNNNYNSRKLLYRTAFFIASIIYTFILVKIKTSSYRLIAGVLLMIYSIVSNEPFSLWSHSSLSILIRSIAKICHVSIILFYAFIVRGKSKTPIFILAISICLILFIVQSINVFDIMKITSNYIFSLKTWTIKTNISIIILLCYTLFAVIHHIMNDNDIRNYILLFVAITGTMAQIIDITQSETLLFQIISMGALQFFSMQFPQQMRKAKKIKISQSLEDVQAEQHLSESISESTEYDEITNDNEYSEYDDDYEYDDGSGDCEYSSESD